MIILIADDDKLIRFTMKSMLHDILSDDSNYLEASDGLELVNLIREHQPDIAFVDIKMPYMDGISAIETCKDASPDTEYVIISGYTDFEYAKRCIPLQITEYLVKPVEEEQLTRILTLLREKLRHTKHRSNAEFKLFLLNAFNYLSAIGDSSGFEESALMPGECYYMYGIYSYMGNNRRNTEPSSTKKLLSGFHHLGQSLIDEGFHYGQIYSDEGTPCIIFLAPDDERTRQRLSDAVFRLNLSTGENHINRTILTFQEQSCRELFNQVKRYDACHWLGMSKANNSILPASALTCNEVQYEVLTLLHTLLQAFLQADETAYKETLNTLYRVYRNRDLNLNLKYLAQFMERITGYPVTYGTYKDFCRSLVDMSGQMYAQVEKTDRNLMEEIRLYIQKNYMNDLTISQIASRYNLTPNYLSSLFHQQEGCRLIDYITEVRLNNAKRILLKNSTASVKDVAVMVGYTSARHFSTIFQKSTGMTPSAFRKG